MLNVNENWWTRKYNQIRLSFIEIEFVFCNLSGRYVINMHCHYKVCIYHLPGTYNTQELPCHCGPGQSSQFTATALANYSKLVFVLYQIWYSVFNAYLKYSNYLNSFQEIQIWLMSTIPIVHPFVPPATLNCWNLRPGLFLPLVSG